MILGAVEDGKKELLALESGFRESELSWIEVLVDLLHRGLKIASKLAVGDGALAFWKTLSKVYGQTRWQRCWVPKTANVLNQLSKSIQPKAKEKLHQIWMAPDKAEAQKHFDDFINIYGAKYPKATGRLEKDRDVLLTWSSKNFILFDILWMLLIKLEKKRQKFGDPFINKRKGIQLNKSMFNFFELV